MSEKEKQYLPQSSAGLMRYSESDSKVRLKPSHVVAVSIGFAGLIMILKLLV
ncbi:MAG TPA: preprotein translocase subunit Sec61beta [archaeon]|nr:preprotein translocase subunit Sec61beta [archaeon]